MALSIAARLMRGGTSKGVFVREEALAQAASAARGGRDGVLRALLGGGDPGGLQLDGLGGGLSSTSKVAVMGRDGDGGARYTFAQVGVRAADVDWSASCVNLAAAAGLFARDALLAPHELRPSALSPRHAAVPLWQANAGQRMLVHVPRRDAGVPPAEWAAIAGVPGAAPAILVELLRPCAGRPLLPTGRAADVLRRRDGAPLPATLLWAANPTVFVHARDLGLDGREMPAEVEWDGHLRPEVEALLAQAAERFAAPLTSAMRVCLVSPPRDYVCSDGRPLRAADADIVSRITTEGRIHHAHTASGALNLAAAVAVPGTVPHAAAAHRAAAARPDGSRAVRIAHPAGAIEVVVKMARDDAATWDVERVGMLRTARTLMDGVAYLPLDAAP